MDSKQREALNQLLGLIDNGILVFSNELDPSEVSNAQYHIDKADEALAEPLRNCDVGTAEEQADRFFDFCDGYHYATGYNGCGTCPLWTSGTIGHDCELRWAQMPYEEGDNNADE